MNEQELLKSMNGISDEMLLRSEKNILAVKPDFRSAVKFRIALAEELRPAQARFHRKMLADHPGIAHIERRLESAFMVQRAAQHER